MDKSLKISPTTPSLASKSAGYARITRVWLCTKFQVWAKKKARRVFWFLGRTWGERGQGEKIIVWPRELDALDIKLPTQGRTPGPLPLRKVSASQGESQQQRSLVFFVGPLRRGSDMI